MSQSTESKTWFESWFDTPFYHALYHSRDENEAALFLGRILELLPLQSGARVLDLACGKGRHARFLQSNGFNVLGVDLSESSILQAKKGENPNLHFKVGDMREPQGQAEFDAVFNLFTSFGYFDSPVDNIKTLHSIHASLKNEGWLVIDFMNSQKAINHLQPQYQLSRGGIDFSISKSIENQIIVKKIDFQFEGKSFHFEERVQLLMLNDFKQYFQETGFVINQIFGDYQLHPFDTQESDRLILVARKA